MMSIKYKLPFFIIISLLCATSCFVSYGARKRRGRLRKTGLVESLQPAVVSNEQNHKKELAKVDNSSQKLIEQPKPRSLKRSARKKKNSNNAQKDKVSVEVKKVEPKQEQNKEPSITDAVKTDQKLDQSNMSQEKKAGTEQHIEQKSEQKNEPSSASDETIEFYFENTDLLNVVAQMGQLYDVTFITDDIISPIAPGSKALKGNKLSFKTHHPLTKKEGWRLFITFLDIAGFAIVPESDPTMYRIMTNEKARRSAIPSYIGVAPETLPGSDQIIRYVYFIENVNPDTLKTIITPMLSVSSAPAIVLADLKALILTDKAYNIKTLMEIIKELDKVSMPQEMSVLKLMRADAEEVKKLYEAITKTEESTVMTRLFPARKQPTSLYFPENIRIISEPITNSLILLGPRDAIEKIEQFVQKYIDVEPDKPYSALHTYQLKFAEASTVSKIMDEVTKFGREPTPTPAGLVGGVRGVDKYFKPMKFIPEPSTNQLIIRGDYDDYLKAVEIIKQLDEAQPQVAIEILVLTVELKHDKALGAQIRSIASPGFLGHNAEFQTGNLGTIQTNQTSGTTGSQRLMGNLLNLVKGLAAGNTVVSLGRDVFGVWGVLKALETIANSEVISNPFLVAVNKIQAKVSVGEVRRLLTSQVIATTSQDAYSDEPATLDVIITPQINSDGMISLDLIVEVKTFLSGATGIQAARSLRKIDTKTIVADNEVIALGGLIRNEIDDTATKTPLFGDIPILGWLFKNRAKTETKSNLLLLVSTKIIKPGVTAEMQRFTSKHIDDYYGTIDQMHTMDQNKDPIHKLFFAEGEKAVSRRVEDLLFKEKRKERSAKRKVRRKRKQKKQAPTNTVVSHNEINKQNPLPVEKDRVQKKGHEQLLAKRKKRSKISLTGLVDDHGESQA